jgi:hypothetical protein
MQAIQSYAKGDMSGVLKAGMGIFKVATGAQDKATKIARETKGSQADVVCDVYSTDPASMNPVLNVTTRFRGVDAKTRKLARMPRKPARPLAPCPTLSSHRWVSHVTVPDHFGAFNSRINPDSQPNQSYQQLLVSVRCV